MEQQNPPRNLDEALRIQRILFAATFAAPLLMFGALWFMFARDGAQPVPPAELGNAFYACLAFAALLSLVLPLLSFRAPRWFMHKQGSGNPWAVSTVG
ncbi:MAG: hypothetical protein ACK4N5_20875, partial [Myxococcales bacterium]